MDLNPLVSVPDKITKPCERYADRRADPASSVTQIHFTGFFLPWHRAYVNDFEAALRTECNYKGIQPYWDWTLGQLARLQRR